MNFKNVRKKILKTMKDRGITWGQLEIKTGRSRVALFKTIHYAKEPSWNSVSDILKALKIKIRVEE